MQVGMETGFSVGEKEVKWISTGENGSFHIRQFPAAYKEVQNNSDSEHGQDLISWNGVV